MDLLVFDRVAECTKRTLKVIRPQTLSQQVLKFWKHSQETFAVESVFSIVKVIDWTARVAQKELN